MGYATGILHRIQLNIYEAYKKGTSVEELAQRYEVSELKILMLLIKWKKD